MCIRDSLSNVRIFAPPPPPGGGDPLAQTFFVDDETGIFLTKVDVFFQTKDDNIPVIVQLRETTIGTPNLKILPYSEVELDPKDINLSTDGTVPTTIEFDAPVYVEGQKEYALILLSDSLEYRVFISRLGEVDVTTATETENEQTLVSKQPILGSLFKSQNASVWTPSQYEDLKFNLYRANFTSQGFVGFFNPQLPTSLSRIRQDGVTIRSRNLSVGIGTTVQDANLEFGNTILQAGKSGRGTLVGYAGSATSTLTITNTGIGYTPSSGGYTFTGVALTSVTGNGLNATADIFIEGGVAVGATIAFGGKGYAVGDVLRPLIVGNNQLGRNMKLSVGEISGNNELIIDNVQGEFDTSTQLSYINNAGITTTVNSSIGGNAIPTSPIRVNNDGLHMEIFQRNHGMHTRINQVTLSDIGSDISPTTLSVAYSRTETGSISIGNSSVFGVFEGVGIGSTNPGYARIGKEVISYTGVTANTLTGIGRGVDNTQATNHASSDLVYKYELDWVSLDRMKKTHDVLSTPDIDFESYNIKIDMANDGVDRTVAGYPLLYSGKTKSTGGEKIRATQNIPFELITPVVDNITLPRTSLSAEVRTTTGVSIDGEEDQWLDNGFEPVSINETNYLETPRLIASKVNADEYLTQVKGKKSMNLRLILSSGDSRVSPVIDSSRINTILTSNSINNPITDYANDSRVNSLTDDPNACQYVSGEMILELSLIHI